MQENSVVMWDKYTLKTTFQAINKNDKTASSEDKDELLAHGYWGVNGSESMILPPGVERMLLD